MYIPRRTAHRVLAILMAALVLSFALQAAGHWHANSFEDQQCRVCHVAHSVAVDLSLVTTVVAPDVVVRLISPLAIDPQLDPVFHRLSSRGPPA
ncbi:MAG: hypothetical protein WB780_14300 [Candidatus Acidiferrales bacterium]